MVMSIEINGETYLDAKEACERLSVSRETLNTLVNEKKLGKYKQGVRRNVFYKESEVNRLLEVRRVDS
jgi:excisionase family DNA binding protein